MPPVAFVVSAIAFVRRQNRRLATIGILLSAACVLVFFGLPILAAFCR
jgi:hypothetical protein